MNHTLPPRDRGHQGGDPGGQSGSQRTVPGIVRLVGGTADTAGRVQATKKPPEPSPGGGKEKDRRRSGFERIGALAIFALGRFYAESHLLAKRTADESTNTVRLPLGCGHQFLEGGSAGAFQQLQNLCGFAALPRSLSLRSFGRGFRLFGRLAAFFGGVAFFPGLPFAGATWAPCAGTRAFLVALGWALCPMGWAVSVCFVVDVVIL